MAGNAKKSVPDKSYLNLRQRLELLRSQLDNERVTFKPQWRDLADYILPRRPRFFVTDVNKGDRRNQKILDTTPTMAARTLSAGMMSGVTSPARPWFRLTISDRELAEDGEVKMWLDAVQSIISTSFLKSNLYNVLPIIYGDMGVFGTSCMFVEEDFTGEVMKFHPFPIGSYMISQNEKLKVDTFYREFQMTVRQMIEKFGYDTPGGEIQWDRFSTGVKSLYEKSQLETWVGVAHAITKNKDYDETKLQSKFKKYSSTYYERGTMGSANNTLSDLDQTTYLSQSGFDYFPALAPRWEVTGEDVYGTNCPGMVALGDVKQLQNGERKALQAIEKSINPPMTGPSSLRNQSASLLPGDITYLDVNSGQQGFRPAYEIRFDINAMESKQAQVRERISKAFFEDLFLMMASSDRRQITATEVDERREEKMLALGPVLERINDDLLDPLLDIAFKIHVDQGLLPEPPEKIRGSDLKVEYLSIMAQAQKIVGIGGVDRFAAFIGQHAQIDPSVLDKYDMDQAADVYADMTAVPPSIVRTDEAVAAMRQQRAEQQAQQQKLAAMEQMAGAAKDLSAAKTDDESALTQILGNPDIVTGR